MNFEWQPGPKLCPENSPQGTALSSRGRKPPESRGVSMEPQRGERQSPILSETRLQPVQIDGIVFMPLSAPMQPDHVESFSCPSVVRRRGAREQLFSRFGICSLPFDRLFSM